MINTLHIIIKHLPNQPVLQLVLVKIAIAQQGIFPPNSSNVLCLLFCIIPSSMGYSHQFDIGEKNLWISYIMAELLALLCCSVNYLYILCAYTEYLFLLSSLFYPFSPSFPLQGKRDKHIHGVSREKVDNNFCFTFPPLSRDSFDLCIYI